MMENTKDRVYYIATGRRWHRHHHAITSRGRSSDFFVNNITLINIKSVHQPTSKLLNQNDICKLQILHNHLVD